MNTIYIKQFFFLVILLIFLFLEELKFLSILEIPHVLGTNNSDVFYSGVTVQSSKGILFSPLEPSFFSSFQLADLGLGSVLVGSIAMLLYCGYNLYCGTPAVIANIGPDAAGEIAAGGLVPATTAIENIIGVAPAVVEHIVGVQAALTVIGNKHAYGIGTRLCRDYMDTGLMGTVDNLTYHYFLGYITAYSGFKSSDTRNLDGLEYDQYLVGFEQGNAALAAFLAGGAHTLPTSQAFGVWSGFIKSLNEKKRLSYEDYLALLHKKRAAAEAAAAANAPAEIPASLPEIPASLPEIPSSLPGDIPWTFLNLFYKFINFLGSFFPPGA